MSRGRFSIDAVLAIASALIMAAGLLAVSYGHCYEVAELAGASGWRAAIMAAVPDGLIVISISVLGVARRAGEPTPWIVRAGLAGGIAMTTAANLAHGVAYGVTGVVVALCVPIVAEIAYQLAMYAITHGRIEPVRSGEQVAEAAEDVEEDDVPELAPAAAVRSAPVVCSGFVPLEVARASASEAAERAVTAAAVRAVRQADAIGAPLSLRRLAAAFPAADGRPRSTHWATGIKEQAAAGPADTVSGRPRVLSGLSVVPNSA